MSEPSRVIKRLCTEAEPPLSYRELGQAASTHPALVGKIANGRVTENADYVVLVRLADALRERCPDWHGSPADLQRWEVGE